MEFLARHDPQVIVYDVSIPYEENWNFLRLLMSSDDMEGRCVVIATTNKKVLESFVGEPTQSRFTESPTTCVRSSSRCRRRPWRSRRAESSRGLHRTAWAGSPG